MTTSIINGVELYYEIRGTGDSLVLTHGSWTDGAGWGPALDVLADRYRVVTWDRRGHSRSKAGDLVDATSRAAAAIPDARIHILEGHGHLAHHTDPALVAALIQSFVADAAC